MLGSHIRGAISYYDQLGIAPNATPEEIRQAYRTLVRLLHPDQQTDPDLKFAAETQLRKLNRIHRILIDPEQRRAYDEHLAAEWAPQPPQIEEQDEPFPRRKQLIVGAWVAGILATILLVSWLGWEGPQAPSLAQPEIRSSLPKPPQEKKGAAPEETTVLRQSLQQALASRDEALTERDAALREIAKLKENRKEQGTRMTAKQDAPPSQGKAPAPAAPAPEQTVSNTTPPAPSPTPAAPAKTENVSSARKLAGFWFYVRPKDGQQNRNRALYPPEFIEISIQEENGNVKGKYRARYRILDRPISPDVNFEFAGKENGGACACTWRGIGGARGQIGLQLIAEGSMKFDWTATELGTQQGLASGTAILTRRTD